MKLLILGLLLSVIVCSCSNDVGDKLEYYPHFNQTRKGIVILDSILRINNVICNSKYDVMLIDNVPFLRRNENSGQFNLTSFCLPIDKANADLDSVASIMKYSYLSSAVEYNGVYLFNHYFYNKNNDYDYTRYLVVDKAGVVGKLKDNYRILDIRDGVILLSFKYKRR